MYIKLNVHELNYTFHEHQKCHQRAKQAMVFKLRQLAYINLSQYCHINSFLNPHSSQDKTIVSIITNNARLLPQLHKVREWQL